MRPSGRVTVVSEPAGRLAGGRTTTRQRGTTVVAAVALIGVLSVAAIACGGATPRPGAANVSSLHVRAFVHSSSNRSMNRDPAVIVNALDRAGLALCHSDYNDLPQYDIYALLGAYSTRRYFAHRSAVPVQTDGAAVLSCLTPGEPNTGAIEIDVYPSPAEASRALREVGQVWLGAWVYGNLAVVVDQTTPPSVAQEVSQVLNHVPGALQVNG